MISEVRNSLEEINNRLDTAEGKNNKLEGKTIENREVTQRIKVLKTN